MNMKKFNRVISIVAGFVILIGWNNILDIKNMFVFSVILSFIGVSAGYCGANIGDYVRRQAMPQTIYYRNPSDLMKEKIKYTFGLNITGVIVGAWIGIMIFLIFLNLGENNWKTIALGIIYNIVLYGVGKLTEKLLNTNI